MPEHGSERGELQGACSCGAVTLTVAAAPSFLIDCNCSLCRTRNVAWAYYPSAAVLVSGTTNGYRRADKEQPSVDVHACVSCGQTTHWTLTEEFLSSQPDQDRVGVNMRLFDIRALAGAELRFLDGEAWSGSAPAEHRRPSIVLSADHRWATH